MKKRFTGNTRLYLGISCAIIVVALIMQICGVGLNLGIDFTGGSVLSYSVGEDYDVNDVETILSSVGYEGAQITKAAPSEASIALQAKLSETAEEAPADETLEAAPAEETAEEAPVEETETTEEAVEEVTEEATEAPAEETATEETAEEAPAEEAPAAAFEPMLNTDKSGIAQDGMTDLEIRLVLVDEAAGMEDCVKNAVTSVVAGAAEEVYGPVTFTMATNEGFDGEFTGSYVMQVEMNGDFDKDAVADAVNAALAESGFSINRIAFERVDGSAPVEAAAEETEAPAEETTEETAEATEAPAEETVEETTEETGTKLRIYIDLNDQTTKVRTVLEQQMQAKYPNFRFVSIDHVSAIAGRDLLSNAVKALLIAFACMLLYIAIRFDALSGLAALFGLLHDVLVMLSFMVFFRALFQVNSSFIAAILTIIGYSINNTIIIFDRIRENAKKPGNTMLSKVDIVETSVASTLSRTINTSLTTLITLVALYICGVDSIREFAFPLIVGMLAGTYSSVMLSGQVWAFFSDKRAAKKGEAPAAEAQETPAAEKAEKAEKPAAKKPADKAYTPSFKKKK